MVQVPQLFGTDELLKGAADAGIAGEADEDELNREPTANPFLEEEMNTAPVLCSSIMQRNAGARCRNDDALRHRRRNDLDEPTCISMHYSLEEDTLRLRNARQEGHGMRIETPKIHASELRDFQVRIGNVWITDGPSSVIISPQADYKPPTRAQTEKAAAGPPSGSGSDESGTPGQTNSTGAQMNNNTPDLQHGGPAAAPANRNRNNPPDPFPLRWAFKKYPKRNTTSRGVGPEDSEAFRRSVAAVNQARAEMQEPTGDVQNSASASGSTNDGPLLFYQAEPLIDLQTETAAQVHQHAGPTDDPIAAAAGSANAGLTDNRAAASTSSSSCTTSSATSYQALTVPEPGLTAPPPLPLDQHDEATSTNLLGAAAGTSTSSTSNAGNSASSSSTTGGATNPAPNTDGSRPLLPAGGFVAVRRTQPLFLFGGSSMPRILTDAERHQEFLTRREEEDQRERDRLKNMIPTVSCCRLDQPYTQERRPLLVKLVYIAADANSDFVRGGIAGALDQSRRLQLDRVQPLPGIPGPRQDPPNPRLRAFPLFAGIEGLRERSPSRQRRDEQQRAHRMGIIPGNPDGWLNAHEQEVTERIRIQDKIDEDAAVAELRPDRAGHPDFGHPDTWVLPDLIGAGRSANTRPSPGPQDGVEPWEPPNIDAADMIATVIISGELVGPPEEVDSIANALLRDQQSQEYGSGKAAPATKPAEFFEACQAAGPETYFIHSFILLHK